MRRSSLLTLSIVCLPILVNASSGKASAAKHARKAATMSPREFVAYMLKNADDAVIPAGRSARVFDLPIEGDSLSIKGDSTDPGEIGRNKQSNCELILERKDGAMRPHCLLIVIDDNRPKERIVHGREYKFDLEGNLKGAVAVEGKLDDHGDAIDGSGSQPKQLDVNDPSVAKRAREEINFWLERTAKRIAEKKKAQKKTSSTGGGGAEAMAAKAQ